MRVAVLADIHGNLPALDAVLAGVDAAGVETIVLAGDLADGPLRNTDRWLVDAFDGCLDLPRTTPRTAASDAAALEAFTATVRRQQDGARAPRH